MHNKACLNKGLFCISRDLACLAIAGIKIMYLWDSSGGKDLDTKTECMGESVGFGRGGGITKKTYLRIDRDDTSSNGRETITIFARKIRKLKPQDSTVSVSLNATWYGEPTGGGFRIKIVWGQMEKEREFSTMLRYNKDEAYLNCGTVAFDLKNKEISW